MNRLKSSVLLPVSLLTMTACSSNFDPGSRVTSLRVLAVRADHPFAAPGESVALEALAFDPREGTRPLNFGWTTCVNPMASTVEGCLAAIGMEAARTGVPPVVVIGPER